MTWASLTPLANHLWQSTLFAAVAWLLALALRQNRAPVRYWIWMAASVKFLIPFSLLVSAGGQLGWRTAPAIAHSQFSFAMDEIGQPFAVTVSAPLPAVAAPAQPHCRPSCSECGYAASRLAVSSGCGCGGRFARRGAGPLRSI